MAEKEKSKLLAKFTSTISPMVKVAVIAGKFSPIISIQKSYSVPKEGGKEGEKEWKDTNFLQAQDMAAVVAVWPRVLKFLEDYAEADKKRRAEEREKRKSEADKASGKPSEYADAGNDFDDDDIPF